MRKLDKYRSLIVEVAGDPLGTCDLHRHCSTRSEISSKVIKTQLRDKRLLFTAFVIFITFADYDQLAKDFTRVFLNLEPSCVQNAHLFDVVFLVGQSKQKARFIGVRAILGVRSRVFQVCAVLSR